MAGRGWLVALVVGMTLLLYPLFNQLKDTSLEAMRDADHQGTIDRILFLDRDLDRFPDDEELEYWNGRLPEGREFGPDGDIDRDGVPNKEDPDSDGDGRSDGDEFREGADPGKWDDYDPEEHPPPANETEPREMRERREPLWEFRTANGASLFEDRDERFGVEERFRTLLVTFHVEDFEGNLRLAVRHGGVNQERSLGLDSAGNPRDLDDDVEVSAVAGTWQGEVEYQAVRYESIEVQVIGIWWEEAEAAA